MSELLSHQVVISEFHNEYDTGLDQRAHNLAVTNEMEEQFESGDAPTQRLRRIGTIAVSEAALELAQDGIEYASCPEQIINMGIQQFTKILAADRIGIHLIAEDTNGNRSIVKFRQKKDDDKPYESDTSAGDLVGGILQAIEGEFGSRSDFYSDLAELSGRSGMEVAEHMIRLQPATEVALAAGRSIMKSTVTDFVNNSIQAFAALDNMQRSGVQLYLTDALGNESDLPLFRPMAIGPGESPDKSYDPLTVAQTFIESLKASGDFEPLYRDGEFEQIMGIDDGPIRPRHFKKLFAEVGSDKLTGYGYETPKDITRAILQDIYVGSVIHGLYEKAGIAYALHDQLMRDTGRPLRQKYRLLQALHYARKAEVDYGNALEDPARQTAYSRAIHCTVEINRRNRDLQVTWPVMQKYLDRGNLLPSVWGEQFQWEKRQRELSLTQNA